MSIELSPDFFNLQLRFARRVTQVGSYTFEEAILNFTNIYLQCLGRSFDAAHPAWQAYLEGLRRAPDSAVWTYAFYESQRGAASPPSGRCFQHTYLPDEQVIRLHFTNGDTSGYGPLSQQRRRARIRELKALFAETKQRQPDARVVRGCSWLYNLDAYRRLFPTQYTVAMEVAGDEFQFLSLWGQFLQRNGRVREKVADSFLSACQKQRTLDDLLACFPFHVLATSCPITVFYEYYERLPLTVS